MLDSIILNNWLMFYGLLILIKHKLSLMKSLDRNKTDLHRFKPNSRTLLIDEQSNHLSVLPDKDKMSRHRGRKLQCRYERYIVITLLSL